ncbi:MAG: hypothetical protein A3J38_03600 [Gammaproteobacteria bacterium RIFCSPHIGHO2_12_FULL_45_9]|nr:MAG: hypothetical protein A3J38_03600 [Gammaproteobacteria bacterium RIFCSPHIGHO2_12_FULL_45_9]
MNTFILPDKASINSEEATQQFHIAAATGNLAIVDMLIAQGIALNSVTGLDRATPLYRAAEGGHTAVVQTLLNAGANRTLPCTSHGLAALHIAARNGHTEVVQTLLKPIDPNAIVSLMNPHAFYARRYQHTYQINTLTPFNPNLRSGAQLTPLHLAAQYGQLSVVAALVNTPGIILDLIDEQEQATPLYMASATGHAAIVSLLLSKGATPHCLCGTSGLSPFLVANLHHHDAVVAALEYSIPGLGNPDVSDAEDEYHVPPPRARIVSSSSTETL